MQVSVIIPVYNAEKYVREAVESALAQPETGEIILVEDGSPDNAIQVCQELEKEYSKVRLFQHPNGENRGAGASRNLGIQNAQCDFIAFLDADDFYLRDRFTVAKDLFSQHSDIDGVYEAVGTYFENEKAREKWLQLTLNSSSLTTLKKSVAPDDLLDALLTVKFGLFHTNGIVVRKSIFEKTGYFDTHLKLKQDTAMWIKMSAVGKLVSGRLRKPVALRRVHNKNRIFAPKQEDNYYRFLLLKTLFEWSVESKLHPRKIQAISEQYIPILLCRGMLYEKRIKRKKYQIKSFVWLGLKYPFILRYNVFWRYLVLIFGIKV